MAPAGIGRHDAVAEDAGADPQHVRQPARLPEVGSGGVPVVGEARCGVRPLLLDERVVAVDAGHVLHERDRAEAVGVGDPAVDAAGRIVRTAERRRRRLVVELVELGDGRRLAAPRGRVHERDDLQAADRHQRGGADAGVHRHDGDGRHQPQQEHDREAAGHGAVGATDEELVERSDVGEEQGDERPAPARRCRGRAARARASAAARARRRRPASPPRGSGGPSSAPSPGSSWPAGGRRRRRRRGAWTARAR